LEKETDKDGHIQLDVETEFKSEKVEIVINIQPASPKNHKYDFSDLVGKLKWDIDPVEYQRRLRDEWK